MHAPLACEHEVREILELRQGLGAGHQRRASRHLDRQGAVAA
jgi:hypothetical protein